MEGLIGVYQNKGKSVIVEVNSETGKNTSIIIINDQITSCLIFKTLLDGMNLFKLLFQCYY